MGIHCLIHNQREQILVIRRSLTDEHEPGYWDLPGGGVNEKESLELALQREVLEEVGIHVDQPRILFAYNLEDGEPQLIAEAEAIGGEAKLSNEHDGFEWVDEKEIIRVKPASIHLRVVQYCRQTGKTIVEHYTIPT